MEKQKGNDRKPGISWRRKLRRLIYPLVGGAAVVLAACDERVPPQKPQPAPTEVPERFRPTQVPIQLPPAPTKVELPTRTPTQTQ